MEYAQLNHDADHHGDHGYHGDHSTQDDHIDEIDSRVDNNTVTMENENMTQSQTVDWPTRIFIPLFIRLLNAAGVLVLKDLKHPEATRSRLYFYNTSWWKVQYC